MKKQLNVIKERDHTLVETPIMNKYRRKDGPFSKNPQNVKETRSKGHAKLTNTVGNVQVVWGKVLPGEVNLLGGGGYN